MNIKLSKSQMEQGLQRFLENHHPRISKNVRVRYAPRRRTIFEARKSRGRVQLTFSIPPTSPSFKTHLSEAVRALKEIHYGTTSAVKIRNNPTGEKHHA